MKIKEVEIGSTIQCCGATAEVLSRGAMGTRVKVIKLPKLDHDQQGFHLGITIWSNLAEVTIKD